MACSVDHISVPVPTGLFALRLARVNDDTGAALVLATQLADVVHAGAVEVLRGRLATPAERRLLMHAGDVHQNTTKCKLGALGRQGVDAWVAC